MANSIPCFPEGQIESLARLLGDCVTGDDITRVFFDRHITDSSGQSTKWRRLYWVFLQSQKDYHCANIILDFIKSLLLPSRFIDKKEIFEITRSKLNENLAFSGLEYCNDGNFRFCDAVRTIDEAEKRVQIIRLKLQGRSIHPEVYKYCRKELMQENFFHAVFEATKGLAQRIRELSGVQGDGFALIDKVFSLEKPIVALNSLRTDTEKSEHKGFAALLKGCFSAIRNPLAHEPKILWNGEDDAADYLTLISMLHRKMDSCVKIKN
jgi:uncharacterized protein (TIGR02391 family)